MLLAAVSVLATLCFGAASASLTCRSESQPNPIPITGGENPTGTINGTLAILPIPLAEARRIIDEKYIIETAAYGSLLPYFPIDMYPALIQAVVDHDVRAKGLSIPDFTRISIEYPFLSIPEANTSTLFRYAPIQAISADNPIAIAGSVAYGTRVLPVNFDPPCDGYASMMPASMLTHLDAKKEFGDKVFTTTFATAGGTGAENVNPYPLSFFVNVTNQPSFVDPMKGCDRQVRLFDTVISQAPWKPVVVKGGVWASGEVYPGDLVRDRDGEGRRWHGAWGVRVDTSFIEYNLIKCGTL
ncbi:hypothetical protein SLS58_004627 [Diplodia intermedia]|uniref:Uncharacterized protein n=1 Tax=Diplodia intermedia TaxID=856260 RepID=A0ABR3TTC1_9PEZI